MNHLAFALAALLPLSGAALAGEVDVVDAKAALTRESDGKGFWRFDVTLRHADEGWDHYADAWEVLDPSGAVLGVRTLFHPHVEEQPFTRSLTGVEIPRDVKRVTVRAHDKVHGYGGVELELTLPWDGGG